MTDREREPDFAALDAAADDIASSGEPAQPSPLATPTSETSAPKPESAPSEATGSMRRFRGQFMDMVHPSSDVKNTEKHNLARRSNNPFAPPSSDQATAPPDAEKPGEPTESSNSTSSVSKPVDEEVEKPAEVEEDAYKSPFLPDAKVEKRPLGISSSDANVDLLSIEESDVDLLPSGEKPDQESLPSGETGDELLVAGEEVEALLPVGDKDSSQNSNQPNGKTTSELDQNKSNDLEPETPQKKEETTVDHLPRQNAGNDPAGDTRAAINNTMIMPQYKTAPPSPAHAAQPQSPYAAAAEPIARTKNKNKHFPVWAWILIFILLAAAGAALGAWLYTSGWLTQI